MVRFEDTFDPASVEETKSEQLKIGDSVSR